MLTTTDMGKQLVADADGQTFLAYVTAGWWTCPKCNTPIGFDSRVDVALAGLHGDPAEMCAAETKAMAKMVEAEHVCQ